MLLVQNNNAASSVRDVTVNDDDGCTDCMDNKTAVPELARGSNHTRMLHTLSAYA